LNLFVVIALALSLGGLDAPLGESPEYAARLTAAGLYVGAILFAALALAARTVRRLHAPFYRRTEALETYRRGHLLLQFASLGLFAALATQTHWPASAAHFVGHTILLERLAAAAPYLVAELGVIACMAWVDSKLRIFARAFGGAEGFPSARAYIDFHARLQLGVPLVLVLSVATATDLVWRFAPLPRTVLGPLAALLQVGLMLLSVPWVIRWVLGARPLPAGELRDAIADAARKSRLRFTDYLVWPTDRAVMNALAPATLFWPKYVIFSDALLERLSKEEVVAVFGHEAGHYRHRHIPYMMAYFWASALAATTLGPWLAWAVEAAAPASLADAVHAAFQTVPPGLALFPFWLFLTFGPIWRMFERQADLFGARVASAAFDDSANLAVTERGAVIAAMALERVAALSGRSRHQPDWRHGSIAERVEFLLRSAADPELADRFDGRFARIKWAAVLTLLSAAAALALVGPAPGQPDFAAALAEAAEL
jgi:Zn-dependent protease with chaperone function